MNNRFFSVIMPIYNVEDYLAEAIDSVVNQSVGFEENIELILVNDGSSDNSGDICKSYLKKYPDNIVYIEKENSGVSDTRNVGAQHATGEFINFMDSDDVWDKDSFMAVRDFLLKNPDIKMAFSGLKVFGRNGIVPYYLDYQYRKTRIIDIEKTFNYPQVKVITGFVSREVFRKVSFDDSLAIGEDVLYINLLLLKARRFAIVSDAVYYYRKREKRTSAMDTASVNTDYYTVTPDKLWTGLAEASLEEYGEVIPYIQYLLITNIYWRLYKKRAPLYDFLTEKQIAMYENAIYRGLSYVEPKIIAAQKEMSISKKIYALRIKERNAISKESQTLVAKKLRLSILLTEQHDNHLLLTGVAHEKYIGTDWHIYAKDNKGNVYPAEYDRYPVSDISGVWDGICLEGYRFRIDIPVQAQAKYRFYLSDGDQYKRSLMINWGKLSKFNYLDTIYSCGNGFIYKIKERKAIQVYNRRIKTELASAYRYYKELDELAGSETAEIWRKAFLLKKRCSNKPIWIISDRSHMAGDNGEALFTYLMKTDAKHRYNIYFLLDRNSEDYQRIKKIGKVIEYGSKEHLIKQLAASLIISSQADNWVIDPFGSDQKYYRNIYDYKFVYLQHGVIKDDLSKRLHLYSKNIKLFCTAAKPEYESVVKGNYGYDDSVVKLTGLARYDKLQDGKKKIIAIAPTWRKDLAAKAVAGSERAYSDEFKNSDYYNFYNNLINDERLIRAMSDNGYTGYLYMHPIFEHQARDFNGNDTIKVWDGGINYSKVFEESSLLVTDYSSAAFDFAYLKKPVVYTQFDYEHIFDNHFYLKDYYDYDSNGFGPVARTYDEAVDAIIKIIKEDCRELKMYEERADSFFEYTDHNNCERIYSELKALC